LADGGGDDSVTEISPGAESADELLVVGDLVKHFPVRRGGPLKRVVGAVRAVDRVSFSVRRGETLGLVGESGCGKSTVGRMIIGLQRPTSGTIRFDGRETSTLTAREFRPLRTDIQMIFQDPYSSLNPRHTVGAIVSAPFQIHRVRPEGGVKREVRSLMERVGLNPEHYNRYPSEFSGGQRQRIGIARALALRPKLIVCDEPVSALDVSVRAQVVNLLEDLQTDYDLTYLFIAHDLSVVRHSCDRVAVMYLGRLVEIADRDTLYERPLHPYTRALMAAVPIPDPTIARSTKPTRLVGELPSPSNPPSGCVFHTRCPKYQTELDRDSKALCRNEPPVLEDTETGHQAACHFPETPSLWTRGASPQSPR
jgi:peptide/nickel transport system ATP-binding protein